MLDVRCRGFLAPVVFIPFVEVTLTAEQEQGVDKADLVAMLQRWGKAGPWNSYFNCR